MKFIIISFISTSITVVPLVQLIALVVAIIFYIIDLVKNKSFEEKLESYFQKISDNETQYSNPQLSDTSVDLGSTYHRTITSSPASIKEKMKILEMIKKQNLLSPEDYEKLEQAILNQEQK